MSYFAQFILSIWMKWTFGPAKYIQNTVPKTIISKNQSNIYRKSEKKVNVLKLISVFNQFCLFFQKNEEKTC